MRQDKAPCAGNGHALGKHGNAVMAHSERSLRASRWPIICGLRQLRVSVALACKGGWPLRRERALHLIGQRLAECASKSETVH